MCHIQYHRSPDDYGIAYFDYHHLLVAEKKIEHTQNGRVALAHRKLSIIDLTARGRQPMSDIKLHTTVRYIII